jgi:hypothetical protein
MENCAVLKLVQEQLNGPDMEEVKIHPGTYEVYETIIVPPMKRLVGFLDDKGKHLVILNGHVMPVLDFKSPLHSCPAENLSITDACSVKQKE